MPDFLWFPAAELYGIQRVDYLDDVLVLCGANKGDADPRPPLGSGYERVDPVMPHRPIVPQGAPAELRLDAKKADVIPEYPY